MDVGKTNRVVLITNIPNPYRVPLFNEFAQQLAAKGASLKVVFAAKTYERRLFKISKDEMQFDYEFLDSKAIDRGKDTSATFLYAGVEEVLQQEQPTHVIVSGFSAATAKVVRKAKRMGYSTFVWSGTVLPFTGKLAWAKNLWRKRLVKKVDGFICYGTKAQNYLVEHLGVSRDKITISFNTVDTKFFGEETTRLRAMAPKENDLRQLTSISYLTDRKDNKSLIDLVVALKKIRTDFVLNLLGDGEQGEELKAYARQKGVSEQVIFHGFVQKQDVPAHFALTDVFFFNTKFDIWGLVLNEAMSAGLACIASVNGGSTHDLIQDGNTGFSCDFANIDDVVAKVNELLDNEELRNEIGRNARQLIETKINLKTSANSIVKALAI